MHSLIDSDAPVPSPRARKWITLTAVLAAAATGLSSASNPSDEEDIIALFAPAVAAKEDLPGWAFFASGGTGPGEREGWQRLGVVAREGARGRESILRGIPVSSEEVDAEQPHFTAGGDAFGVRDAQGVASYAVSTFTMPRDSAGFVWLANGNLRNRTFRNGTDLRVLVNGTEVMHQRVAQDRLPFLFQAPLGQLAAGDVIAVAVGAPEGEAKGGGRLRFSLVELPEGEEPPPPSNLLWLPIDTAGPQFDAEGNSAEYEERHATMVQEFVSRDPGLVFLGDSITARWPDELLEQEFGRHSPQKLAVGGDWIQNVRWRVERIPWEKAGNIRVIVLLIGTNNIANHFTPEEIAGGMRDLLALLEKKNPSARLLLLGILPRGTSINNPVNETVREVNQRLAALADGERVVFLDVGSALVEEDGSILPEVMPDQLHVALPGYRRWMTAMKPVIVNLLQQTPPDPAENTR